MTSSSDTDWDATDTTFATTLGALATYVPVMATVVFNVQNQLDKLPHHTLSGTQEMAVGLLAAGVAHVGLGSVFDRVGRTEPTSSGIRPNARASLIVSGVAAIGIMGAHLNEKAGQFNDMAESVARECYTERLPEGTEVTRHRWADDFYTYECPRLNPSLGPRNMPTGRPVAQGPIALR